MPGFISRLLGEDNKKDKIVTPSTDKIVTPTTDKIVTPAKDKQLKKARKSKSLDRTQECNEEKTQELNSNDPKQQIPSPKKKKKKSPRRRKKKSAKKSASTVDTDNKVTPPSVNPSIQQRPFVLDSVDLKLPYLMFGPRIYRVDPELTARLDTNREKPQFEWKDEIQGDIYRYIYYQALGRRTHHVFVKDNHALQAVMTVEAPGTFAWEGHNIMREWLCLETARKMLKPPNQKHFNFVADKTVGFPNQQPCAIFSQLTEFDLAMARSEHLPNGATEFSTQTAIRLCMVTLQAIHDLHLINYVHRNLHPQNFAVFTSSKQPHSKIFLVEMGYAYDKQGNDVKMKLKAFKTLNKTDYFNRYFQSRAFHRSDETCHYYVDLESWIYMCYDFFSSDALPWLQGEGITPERELLNYKEAFFSGEYDDHFAKLKIPSRLNCIRNRIALLRPDDAIDYPSFANSIMQLAIEHKVDWEGLYDWQLTPDNKPDEKQKVEEKKAKTEEGKPEKTTEAKLEKTAEEKVEEKKVEEKAKPEKTSEEKVEEKKIEEKKVEDKTCLETVAHIPKEEANSSRSSDSAKRNPKAETPKANQMLTTPPVASTPKPTSKSARSQKKKQPNPEDFKPVMAPTSYPKKKQEPQSPAVVSVDATPPEPPATSKDQVNSNYAGPV